MVLSVEQVIEVYGRKREVVWTNGCFDLVHPAHCRLLAAAAELGSWLVVGVNSDRAVRALKGPTRPINSEHDRAEVVASLKGVAAVCIFDDDLPCAVIEALQPAVVVKGAGGGWLKPSDLPETAIVTGYGGKVVIIDTDPAYSSSAMLARVSRL